jgi:hypothetical protein
MKVTALLLFCFQDKAVSCDFAAQQIADIAKQGRFCRFASRTLALL